MHEAVVLRKNGERTAFFVLREHFGLVRPYIEQHSGHKVNTIGDSFMVAFASARSAVDRAIALQRTLAERNPNKPGQQTQIRTGLRTGGDRIIVTRETGFVLTRISTVIGIVVIKVGSEVSCRHRIGHSLYIQRQRRDSG